MGVRFNGVKLGKAHLTKVRLDQGKLSAKLAGKKLFFKELIGAQFIGEVSDGRKINLRIHDLISDPKDPGLSYYEFEYWSASQSSWNNACLPDIKGKQRAILAEGVWDETGKHHSSNSLFTLGCTSSAIGKCAMWGYKPWESVRDVSLQPFHQACTRMVRADYLGNGETHTKDGTLIAFTDILGVNQNKPDSRMKIEAGWGIEGAVFISRLRIPELGSGLSCAQGKGCTAIDSPARKKSGEVLLINYSR